MAILSARATLAEQLPEPLRPLAKLAFNYWWSWQPGGSELWRSIDPELWESCEHNPARLLRECPPRVLQRAAGDPELLARAERLVRGLDALLATAPSDPNPIAFLCAEYGVHESLPVYAGGLGILAGDLLKEASDQRLPMVAVGLLYRRGYFHQRLDPSGWQHEYWKTASPEQLPIEPVLDASGAPVSISVPIRGSAVRATAWRADVGRVPVYLLDADVPENDPISRFITAQLYVGDRQYRLMQYALLGIGGVRLFGALGIAPAVFHINEGHAAVAVLELARQEMAASSTSFDVALARARARAVFTTHTPVLAGNERYSLAELEDVLGPWLRTLKALPGQILALGKTPDASDGEPFGMTGLALNVSRSANAVSLRHRGTARAIWGRPGIAHVTNGVHLPTWISGPMRELLDRHLPSGWVEMPFDGRTWEAVNRIPDEELWAVRCRLRAELVEFARSRSMTDRLARGESIDYVERAARTFDPGVLTVGFARRVASYKRLHLMVADARRALALLAGPRPIQVLMAGKAHPRDDFAKRLVQQIFALKEQPYAAARTVYLEDYDLSIAPRLVAGCDLWLNLPRSPFEACGTSGMKAAMNGGLNLSVLDGWWAEAFSGENGWAIPGPEDRDEAAQDGRDADALYRLLESEVVPLFYQRDERGIPQGWLAKVRASIRSIAPFFNTARALSEYGANVYALPATSAAA